MKTGAKGGGGELPAQQRGKKYLFMRGQGIWDPPCHDQESKTLQSRVPNATLLFSFLAPRTANMPARNAP